MLAGYYYRSTSLVPALFAKQIPSTLASVLGLFRHPRRGLEDPAQMPRIERSLLKAKIDADWLTEVCQCVGLPQDDHCLPPLTFQIAAAPLHLAILADARFPFRALGLVHMSQRITQYQAMPPAAAFDLLAYTTDARWERRGLSFGLVTEAWMDGTLAWKGVTRALASGKSPRCKEPATLRATSIEPPGTHVTEHLIDVPENCGRRYARIAGDRNPIHQHALLARPFGLKRAIVHGTWTMARALALAELPDSTCFDLNATFLRPVELPSQIVIRTYRDIGGPLSRIAVKERGSEATHLYVEVEALSG